MSVAGEKVRVRNKLRQTRDFGIRGGTGQDRVLTDTIE